MYILFYTDHGGTYLLETLSSRKGGQRECSHVHCESAEKRLSGDPKRVGYAGKTAGGVVRQSLGAEELQLGLQVPTPPRGSQRLMIRFFSLRFGRCSRVEKEAHPLFSSRVTFPRQLPVSRRRPLEPKTAPGTPLPDRVEAAPGASRRAPLQKREADRTPERTATATARRLLFVGRGLQSRRKGAHGVDRRVRRCSGPAAASARARSRDCSTCEAPRWGWGGMY